MPLEIRFAESSDEQAWRRLWESYLAFYKVALPADVTAHTWARILDPASRLSMRVAVSDGVMAGFAIHHNHDSTWSKTPDCYLEDLFLAEDQRGKRIGRALIEDLIGLCRENGWSRLYWHTRSDNAVARKLYDSCAQEDGHVRYRMRLTA